MFKKVNREVSREEHHLRVRKKISGTPERSRLSIYRGEKNIYVQIIDNVNSATLVSASSLGKAFDAKTGESKEAAEMVGKLVTEKALEKGTSEVVFDRSGYVYHGRVQTLTEAARETGLRF